VLRDDFGPESDVDMLIEFEPGHMPGLAFIRMQVVVDMPPLVVVLERVVPPDEA
jgi:predicted nucleotidyltransferase